MHFALLTLLAFLAPCFAATAAQHGTPVTADKVVKVAQEARGKAATRMTQDSTQQAVKIKTRHPAPEIRPVVQTSAPAAASAGESEGLSYGTLLATLILMAAIAVRRSTAGRP